MRKQAKKHFIRIEAKKFRFISLRSENNGSFLLPFRFKAKMTAHPSGHLWK
jgi:hypothetical protein